MIPRLKLVPPTTSFRSRFQYNNVTYAVTGEVAAHAAGTTWQSLMHSRIYGPLGMTESYPDAREMLAAGVNGRFFAARHRARYGPRAPRGVDRHRRHRVGRRGVFDRDRYGEMAALPARQRHSGRPPTRQRTELRRAVSAAADHRAAVLSHSHADASAFPSVWSGVDPPGLSRRIHRRPHRQHRGPHGDRWTDPGSTPGTRDLTNLDHSELRHALLYTVFDRFIGPSSPAHDWSAEMRAMYKRIADSTRAARQARESKRVPNTLPTLPLERYTGTYADSLYGTATVGLLNGRLTLQAGMASGQLEHWQYDLFRVTWPDPFWEAAYVSFAIDPDGTVGDLRLVDGGRYRRVK